MVCTSKWNGKRKKWKRRNYEKKQINWRKKLVYGISMPCPIYFEKNKKINATICAMFWINRSIYTLAKEKKNEEHFADIAWTVFILWWLKHMMITTPNIVSTFTGVNKYGTQVACSSKRYFTLATQPNGNECVRVCVCILQAFVISRRHVSVTHEIIKFYARCRFSVWWLFQS